MTSKRTSKAKAKSRGVRNLRAKGLSGKKATGVRGGATGGAGAGKIKFNEFTIKKTTDR